MSKGDLVYAKGISLADSESDEWDDKKLRDAYDRAVQKAKEEVAKQLAMSTNNRHSNAEEHSSSAENKAASVRKPTPSGSKKTKRWTVGMSCRAVYKEDGLEYEAIVMEIIGPDKCIVRFLGYDNSEVVSIRSLKKSRGAQECARQVELATQDLMHHEDMCVDGQNHLGEVSQDCTDYQVPHKADKRKKSPRVKRHGSGLRLPNLPFVMPPDMNQVEEDLLAGCPMPPPIPLPAGTSSDSEQDALSSMLLSWYFSGYYTGYYQGTIRSKKRPS